MSRPPINQHEIMWRALRLAAQQYNIWSLAGDPLRTEFWYSEVIDLFWLAQGRQGRTTKESTLWH